MRDLVFIQSCPIDDYYQWQTHLWLESLKQIGQSHNAISVVFIPKGREYNSNWNILIELYPEAEFSFIQDEDNFSKLLPVYIPLLRPYSLMKYFKKYPELSEKAIFYCDCDIIFTKNFDISKYIDDDINYVSNTLSYINASYFDSKVKDVLPEKLEDYKKINVLSEATELVGTSREIAEKNNLHSGGAQYLLKNIDAKFWDKVITDCIKIRLYLQQINREYFESENKGFQSWAADMWAVLWNLWIKETDVKIIPEMEFAWSTDPISKLDTMGILHNAGVTSQVHGEIPVFYKGTYHMAKSPFSDPHLDIVYNNEGSKSLCNWWYVNKLLELKQKYNLT